MWWLGQLKMLKILTRSLRDLLWKLYIPCYLKTGHSQKIKYNLSVCVLSTNSLEKSCHVFQILKFLSGCNFLNKIYIKSKPRSVLWVINFSWECRNNRVRAIFSNPPTYSTRLQIKLELLLCNKCKLNRFTFNI